MNTVSLIEKLSNELYAWSPGRRTIKYKTEAERILGIIRSHTAARESVGGVLP